jgi:hypothetical protein
MGKLTIALLIALVLAFGCTQGKAVEKPAGGSNTQVPAGTADSSDTFKELDDFSSLDSVVEDPDPGADFSFNESMLG